MTSGNANRMDGNQVLTFIPLVVKILGAESYSFLSE